MWKFALGTFLCSSGAISFGLSFKPQVEIVNPNPLSSYQQPLVKRTGQGTTIIYALGAIALGTGFIGSGLIDLNQLNKQQQENNSLTTPQPSQQQQTSTNTKPTTPPLISPINSPATPVTPVTPVTSQFLIEENPWELSPSNSNNEDNSLRLNVMTNNAIGEEELTNSHSEIHWRSQSETHTPLAQPERSAYSELQTPNSELQTPLAQPERSAYSELQTPNSELPTPNSELRTPNSELPTPYSLLPNMGCVGIIGHQKGSGKTSKLAWLVAEHIKKSHEVWVINPFCPAAHFKGIRVWGKGLNYKNAAMGIRKFAEIGDNRIKRRGIDPNYDPFNDTPLVLILDEVSNYSSAIDKEDPEAMLMFWDLIIQFIRQANMFVAFASHGDTQALLGGNKALAGKSEAIKIAINRIYTQAQIDPSIPGNYRCAGWAYFIEEGGKAKQKIEIPTWMQAPNPEFDYTQLIAEYCPQLMFSEGLKIPTGNLTPEQFKRKLMENENV